MKNSLFDLKTIVSEYKKRIPKPSDGKAVLYKFAMDNKLLNDEEPKKQKKVKEMLEHSEEENQQILKDHVKVEKEHKKMMNKVEKVEKEIIEHKKKSPKKAKKMIKEMVEEKEVKPKSSALSQVQAIRKEKGVSLKVAWGLYKSE